MLEDGSHSPSQQAYFYIGLRNVTKGTLLWERFTFANEPGVPWQSSGLYRYTDWQLVDASGGPGVIDVGDTIQLEVIAAGCNQGGHRGHVYVDAFGSSIPGGTDRRHGAGQRQRRRAPHLRRSTSSTAAARRSTNPVITHHDAAADDVRLGQRRRLLARDRRRHLQPSPTSPRARPATST